MERILCYTAKRIMHFIDKSNKCTEEEQLAIYFGIQILLYNFIVTISILLLSHAVGTFAETLLLFFFFGSYRVIAGGYHFNSMGKCMISTTLIMICGGKCINLLQINLPACIVLCVLFDIVFLFYTPKGTGNNPYSPEYSRLQHKKLMIFSSAISLISVISDTILRPAILISMFITTVLLLPDFYHKFQDIE